MENNKNIRNDKEDSLFGFTQEDILTSRKKLKRLIESVESTSANKKYHAYRIKGIVR